MLQKNWMELIKPSKMDVNVEQNDGKSGTLIAEPLERGFGLTLGNAIRRVLLSSLQGAAITSVKIKGVVHEFSTIPGVKEDLTDILLNLKSIAVKVHSPGLKKMYIKAIYMIPIMWVTMEFFKSYGPLAFSWSSLALTQSNFLPILQMIEYTGSEGISFWIMLVNIFIYLILYNDKHVYKVYFLLMFFIVIPILYGSFKIESLSKKNWEKREISIIQPNIDPNLKWESSYRNQLYEAMDSLNAAAYNLKPDLVLWPEAALPNYMRVSYLRKKYEKLAINTSIPLLMGTLDYKILNGKRISLNGSIYFDGGSKNKMYHKLFLVPFAEYIPLSQKFPMLSKLNLGQGNFNQGNEQTVFALDSTLFSNLICYDLSNPVVVKDFMLNGARFLTVQANVAWLQNSSGVRQFFQIAKLRAIENRTGIAISANTGISGIVNPLGQVSDIIPYNKQKVIKGKVFLNNGVTFYSIYGNIFSKICFLLSASCFIALKLKRL